MSQECHNRASQPDSEHIIHIITEQYLNCVNYMVAIPYITYIVSRVGSILCNNVDTHSSERWFCENVKKRKEPVF